MSAGPWGVDYRWLVIADLNNPPPLVPVDVAERIRVAHATAWSRLAATDRVPAPYAVRDDRQSATSVPPASSASWLPWNIVNGGAVMVTTDQDSHGPDQADPRTLWWVEGVLYAPADHPRAAMLRDACTVERVESVPLEYSEVVTQFITPQGRAQLRFGQLRDVGEPGVFLPEVV